MSRRKRHPATAGKPPSSDPIGGEFTNCELAALLTSAWDEVARACGVLPRTQKSSIAATLKTALSAVTYNLEADGDPTVSYESSKWLEHAQKPNHKVSRHELVKRWGVWAQEESFEVPLGKPGLFAYLCFSSTSQPSTLRSILSLRVTIRKGTCPLVQPRVASEDSAPRRQPSDQLFGMVDSLLEHSLDDSCVRAKELRVCREIRHPPGATRDSYSVTLTPPTTILETARRKLGELVFRLVGFLLVLTLPAGAVSYGYDREDARRSMKKALTIFSIFGDCSSGRAVVLVRGFTLATRRPIYLMRREGTAGALQVATELIVSPSDIKATVDPVTGAVTGSITHQNLNFDDHDVTAGRVYEYALGVKTSLGIETFTTLAKPLYVNTCSTPSPGPSSTRDASVRPTSTE